MLEAQNILRGKSKFFWALLIPFALLVVAAISLVPARHASAASGARHAGEIVVQSGMSWDAWFGNYQLTADGSIVYCAMQVGPPGPPDSATTIYGSVEFVDSYGGFIDNQFVDSRSGPIISGETLNRAAYVLSVYGDTADNHSASVVYALLMQKFEVIPGVRLQGVIDRQSEIDAMWSNATTYAGPYTLNPNVTGARTIGVGRSLRSGLVTDIGALSATGNWLPGYPYTVTINGDAIFTATSGVTISGDGKTATGTTGSAPISIAWEATDTGHFTINEHIDDLPHYLLAIRRATDPADQDLFATQQTYNDASVTYAYQDFQPSSSSKAVHQVYLGEEVYDMVYPQTDGTYEWSKDENGNYIPVVYTVTAYGPYAERQPLAAHVPDGAPVAAIQKFTATGPGEEHKVSFGSDLAAGYYHFVVSVNKADQDPAFASYITDSYFAPFAEDNETTYVSVRAPLSGLLNLVRNPLIIATLGVLLATAVFMIMRKDIHKKLIGKS